jgi:cellulose synthase/poly-beta-1,6-N-acetylglucosamine synthase-like glycosyltransferase
MHLIFYQRYYRKTAPDSIDNCFKAEVSNTDKKKHICIQVFLFVNVFILSILVLFLAYGSLIFYYWQSWKSIPLFTPGPVAPRTKISVIIPARNEEENIGALLQALEHQTYPLELFEVIVVDDHSTDHTADVVKTFPFAKLISLQADHINSYKKKAIENGISSASGELIVTTDADCIPPPEWLRHIAAFREEKKAVFIAAPVAIHCNSSVLQVFQAMDFMVLQGITGASVHKHIHSMSNGANQGYERKAFREVNGFAGIDQVASGDDMLLAHKIAKQHPRQVFYLKSRDAIVSTEPMKTWKEFFHQRIRWASKAARYDDKRIITVLVLVYLFNLAFLALLMAGFWHPVYWYYLGSLWAAKTLAELPFIYSLSSFFGKSYMPKYLFFFQPLHILYTIISGLFGQFGKYEWKGRRVR